MTTLIDDEIYALISRRATRRDYAAGDVIAMQGEPAGSVGYILSGRAKAVSYSENGVETWVGYFASDDFFSHTSLLTDAPADFEITADTDVTAIIIKRETLRALMAEDGRISAVLAVDLAGRLDAMTRRLIEAVSLSARGRVCAELARLSNVIGVMPEKRIIRPNPVLVDIALRVNSTRETVSRTVSELLKKGILSREPGALIVEQPERLKDAIR